jgi:hypothetical protein
MCSRVCPECGELVHYSYYFGQYECSCGWKDDTKKKERENRLLRGEEEAKGKTVFLPKKVWEDFLEGREKNLETFAEGELHYLFGDYPKKYVVEVKVTEVSVHDIFEKGVPFDP